MTDQQDPRNEQYDRVRDAFDSLPIEDKTVFLLKETVNTIVQSVEGAARSIIDEFEGMFGEAPATDAETQEKAAADNGAAKTSKTRKKTTASKGRSTTRKTTSKKTTSSRKKTSPRKKTTKKDDSEDA